MKILFLVQNFPFPAQSGTQMRTARFVEALRSAHELSILSLGADGTLDNVPESAAACFDNLWCVKRRERQVEPKLSLRLGNLLSGVPWEIAGRFSYEYQQALTSILKNQTFDILFARYVYMSQYLFSPAVSKRTKKIVDIDDIEFIKAERQARTTIYPHAYWKYRRLLNNSLLRRYYNRLRNANMNLVCSPEDRDLLRRVNGLRNVEVIPNSISVARYDVVGSYGPEAARSKTIMFCGNLDYRPNREGLVWLVREVLPAVRSQLPDVQLDVVGLCRHADDLRKSIGDSEAVRLHLNVPDVIPYYRRCTLAVVPVHVAGGTRIKVLEALACRRPVLTTTIGAEGLALVDGRHCLIRDGVDGFALGCIELLNDYELGRALTERGYRFVIENFDSHKVDADIRELVNNLASG